MAIAPIAASAIGDTAVVAAVPGKKIRVQRIVLSALAANNVKIRSGSSDLTGLLYMAATQTVPVGSELPGGGFLFETAAGAALNVNLSAATAVGGFVVYSQE